MPKLVLNLALPAMAIVVAALAQLALTKIWPGIQVVPSAGVSLDSYIVLLLTLGMCFLAGKWAHGIVPTVAGAACVAIAPLAWLGLFIRGSFGIGGPIAWFQPLTIFMLSTALAPFIGVALGWALASSKGRRPRGV